VTQYDVLFENHARRDRAAFVLALSNVAEAQEKSRTAANEVNGVLYGNVM